VRLFARVFWAAKAGNSKSEYEDACWPRKPLRELEGRNFRCAVADGATECSYSGVWALQLARDFCKGGWDGGPNDASLRGLQARWSRVVRRRPLPWYAEEKLRAGAAAALLGLVLHDDKDGGGAEGGWKAVAVGDCCFFQVRDETLLQSFPMADSISFTNRPALLSTNTETGDAAAELFRTAEGRWAEGDALYLMTDALACWFMREAEDGGKPWVTLRDLDTLEERSSFPELLDGLRASGALKNDDVTLLRLDVT